MSALLSIVIPVFNRWPLTEACLRSLRKTSARSTVEVIVLDNGSTDATEERCREEVKTAKGLLDVYVRSERNQGFAWGCNLGLAAVNAPNVLFLNNDTEALDGWLPPLLEQLGDSSIGVVGGLLWYPGRVQAVQHAGMGFVKGPQVMHLYRHRRLEHEPGILRAKDLQCVTGAFLGMRSTDARALVGFSTDYLNSFEDVDLCFRVRFELGLRVRYEPRCQLLHHEGQTEGRNLGEAENQTKFLQRWGDKIEVDIGRIMREDRAASTGAG